MIGRSILFAPGNQPQKTQKAISGQADACCIDLEDAVPRSEKPTARENVANILNQLNQQALLVRMNGMATDFWYQDLTAIVSKGLLGIILPRFESQSQLLAFDWVLAAMEREAGIEQDAIVVIPVVETAKGLANLRMLTAPPSRVKQLSFGAWDYTLDTGITYTSTEINIMHARSEVVLCSRNAGLDAPIDTSYPLIGDIEGLEQSCRRAFSMGFSGKACIHPEQVESVNRLFLPSDEEIAQLREIVAAFEAAEVEGKAAVKVNGQFVDLPIYEKARKTIQRFEKFFGAMKK